MPTAQTTDGLTSIANFADFNWNTPSSSNPSWIKTSQTTLYDVYSKELEAKDINGLYAANRMGYNNTKVVLTGSSSNYSEIAYSGAEDEGLTQTNNIFVKAGNGLAVGHGAPAHTGLYSLMLTPASGNKGFVYSVPTANLTPGRNYIASVWVSIGGNGPLSGARLYYTVNGTTVSSATANTAFSDGIWNLLTLVIPSTAIASGPTLEVGCSNSPSYTAYLDDFLFRPVNSVTTAYVYDQSSGELTHMIDRNNLYTRFEYDGAGRLLKTYKEKLGVGELKKTEYQYNMGACQFHNGARTQYFTRNNCSPGYVGSSMPYTVPAGLYCSGINSQDADNQAQNDLNANGQTYVNTRGACFIGGSIQAFAINLQQSSPAEIVLFDAATGSFAGNYVFYNGTTYFNPSAGNYNVEVLTTDHSTKTMSISGYGSQTGSDVTFHNVTIANSQITVNVQ
ncbi:MAG TPA: DUF5977 domain-containing protein [Puia sp.]|jgi:hypothetical protein